MNKEPKGRRVRKERDPFSHVHGTLLHRKRIGQLRDPFDNKFFITFEGIGAERSGPRPSSAGMLCLVPNGNQRLYDFRLGNTSIPDYTERKAKVLELCKSVAIMLFTYMDPWAFLYYLTSGPPH